MIKISHLQVENILKSAQVKLKVWCLEYFLASIQMTILKRKDSYLYLLRIRCCILIQISILFYLHLHFGKVYLIHKIILLFTYGPLSKSVDPQNMKKNISNLNFLVSYFLSLSLHCHFGKLVKFWHHQFCWSKWSCLHFV